MSAPTPPRSATASRPSPNGARPKGTCLGVRHLDVARADTETRNQAETPRADLSLGSAVRCQTPDVSRAGASLELLDDVLSLVTGECPQRLGLHGAVVAELRHDLERRVVVGSLEDLDDVVAAERHPDAHQLPARILDLPLAVLDPVAPGRKPHPPLRSPADERDVVRHARIFSGCD